MVRPTVLQRLRAPNPNHPGTFRCPCNGLDSRRQCNGMRVVDRRGDDEYAEARQLARRLRVNELSSFDLGHADLFQKAEELLLYSLCQGHYSLFKVKKMALRMLAEMEASAPRVTRGGTMRVKVEGGGAKKERGVKRERNLQKERLVEAKPRVKIEEE
ncbi:hypothetical protein LTR09_009479 [Extremus antarcticus]|uniref:Uncharacterized protein n=1 Tax=Extremus antarcticus TaxID=702011 RepID=A0AAJ0DFQ4_9PEZI|nr:hypothetical protein LTR09_009479 [Extremus antarcticus]